MVYEKVIHHHPFLFLFVAKGLYIRFKKGVDLASISPLKVTHRASISYCSSKAYNVRAMIEAYAMAT